MATKDSPTQPKSTPDPATSGLEGVVVARTTLSDVDGKRGQLTIRGYDVEQLAGHASFEEVTHLLWHGELPDAAALAALRARLAGYRALPEEAQRATELAAKRMGPMDALRFAVAALTADDPDPQDESPEANLARAERLVARVPVIVATYERLRRGQPAVPPRQELGVAANFL